MRDLSEIRNDINAVDEQLSALFERRMALAKEVAAYKKENALPIYDPERESAVLAARKKAFEGREEAFLQAVEEFYETLMRLSREEQGRLLEVSGAAVSSGEGGKSPKKITIYTDGACSGNPGPGGYGSILMFTDSNGKTHKKELSGGFASTTNNRMEIYAVIAALEELKSPCKVTLYSDSQYLVKAFTEGWLVKWQKLDWHRDAKKKEKVKNTDLWKRLLKAAAPHEITYEWVKGHASNEYNNRCDELAVAASQDRSQLKEDTGYGENG